MSNIDIPTIYYYIKWLFQVLPGMFFKKFHPFPMQSRPYGFLEPQGQPFFFMDGNGETTNCSCNDFWNHPTPNKRYIKKRMFRGSRYYSMGPPTVVSRFILCIYIYSYTQIRGEIHPSNFTMVFSFFFWTKSCILRTLQKVLWSCVRQHGNIMTYFITSLFSKSPWILLRFFGVLMVGPGG